MSAFLVALMVVALLVIGLVAVLALSRVLRKEADKVRADRQAVQSQPEER